MLENVEEVLKQLINDGLTPQLVCGGEGVDPTVKRPRHPHIPQVQGDVDVSIFGTLIHGLLQHFYLSFGQNLWLLDRSSVYHLTRK